MEDELGSSATYRPQGAERSLDEYAKLDAEDASLAKWKASLGITNDAAAIIHDSSRDDKVLIDAIELRTPGREPIRIDLSTADKVAALRKSPFAIKEGIPYRLAVVFRLQRGVVSGLRYVQVVKRLGVTVDRTEEMMGSYGPAADPYTKVFTEEEAPSGLMARGKYECRSRFIDDDGHCHLDLDWALTITKSWP
ncbi:rho GDP dissociation inhibitor [Savitreella phatthalungensis]